MPYSPASLPRSFRRCPVVLALALVAGFAAPVASQELRIPAGHEDQSVDRIVAVVGDSILFMTDVEEEILRFEARGGQLPPEGEARQAFRREIVESLVNQQLLLQAAAADTTIVVTDERVEGTLRTAWDEEIARWGTETALREELQRSQGLTVTQYRAQLRDQIRRDLMVQSYLQSRRREARPVAVGDEEVEAFFQDQAEQLTRRPATVAFQQAFIQPLPGDSAMAAAAAEIERIMGLYRDGEEFEALARQYSEDPGSRQQGGDLGWFRRGDGLVREFEDAAFQLREGGMAGPVETQFGAHLIRVDRVRGAERRISHILVGAEVGSADMEAARVQAEEVRARLAEGADIREFTERQRSQGLADSVEVAREQLRQVPEAFGPLLLAASEGDVLGPVEFPMGSGQTAWGVFRVTRVRDEGAYTLDDLRPQIRERLQQEKTEERMIRDLRARIFVDIRI
jgi:peptidyl-prolyl cis-trans isomerase SurA